MNAYNDSSKLNKYLMQVLHLIFALFVIGYGIETYLQRYTLFLYIPLVALTVSTLILCWLIYRNDNNSSKIQYIASASYFTFYGYIMLTGTGGRFIYAYAMVFLVLMVLYHNVSLIHWIGTYTIIVNIIEVLRRYFILNDIAEDSIREIFAQLLIVIITTICAVIVTNLYADSIEKNEQHIREIEAKNAYIKQLAVETVTTIANTVEAKDEYTKGHSKRVAHYSKIISKEMGFDSAFCDNIYSVALLHDIGKIGIPDEILNKPSRLTNDEFAIMQQHTIIGAMILRDLSDMPNVVEGAKCHHERWDGSGYPDKLKGEEIPEMARIIAVADAFDAMTSNRCYRKHLTYDVVVNEITKNIGTQFYPPAAEALLRLLKEQGEQLYDNA